MQQRIMILSLALVFGIGAFLMVQSNLVEAATQDAATIVKKIGKPVRVFQQQWKNEGAPSPVIANSLPGFDATKITKGYECSAKLIGGANSTRTVGMWYGYTDIDAINQPDAEELEGRADGTFDTAYVLSNAFRTSNVADNGKDGKNQQTEKATTTQWQTIGFHFREAEDAGNALRVSYRVTDDPKKAAITDPNDESWTLLSNPEVTASNCDAKYSLMRYKIDKTGDFLQYKIQLVGNDRIVRNLFIDAQPLNVTHKPGSNTNGKASPTPTPSASAQGKIFIETKRLVAKASPTPGTTSGVVLPDLTPSPKATDSVAGGTRKPNPDCFSDKNTEPAANVPLTINQLEGGVVKIEDQVTDADGVWRTYLGAEEFPTGTYRISFGEYLNDDYKIVDVCIVNGAQSTTGKIQSSAGETTRPSVQVKRDQQTKVILLYGPRSKPYISLTNLALSSKNKIMKYIVPGQSMRYYIRYENTGEADATDVIIQDLIPEQFYVTGTESQTVESIKNLEMSLDATGRTLVKRKVGTLKQGEKGAFVIPVTLKPDAFGTPDDIARQLPSSASPAAKTSPANSTGGTTNTGAAPQVN